MQIRGEGGGQKSKNFADVIRTCALSPILLDYDMRVNHIRLQHSFDEYKEESHEIVR